ncbi:hypothetical protein FHX35_002246 [Auritidibacter ignavus]|nr:hypothetical protein [Auritidibacter ignavus]
MPMIQTTIRQQDYCKDDNNNLRDCFPPSGKLIAGEIDNVTHAWRIPVYLGKTPLSTTTKLTNNTTEGNTRPSSSYIKQYASALLSP